MALFWYNILGNMKGDPLVEHGACPVIKGEKWIATKWMHENNNQVLRHTLEGWKRAHLSTIRPVAPVDGKIVV